jgi:NAD(P)-dependent dehydrogenase (short-subunit alcohol dehydrogenase family)
VTQRLTDKVAIVTGAAQGIGGATARRLAEEGARVLVADVDAPGAAKNAETIRHAGGTAEPLECDVGTEPAIRDMVQRAVGHWGRLDIVVNNAYAGMGGRADAVVATDETWQMSLNVGLLSMYRAAKYAVPHMRQVGGGAMVNISSVHGVLVAPGAMVYETIKAGVLGLTRQLAVEYGPDRIRVNAICPGHIVTERQALRWQDRQDTLRFYVEQYPLRRTGTPLDIANAVVFLCSEEASFITGQGLVVDGGLSIQLQEDLGVRLARYAQEHPEVNVSA